VPTPPHGSGPEPTPPSGSQPSGSQPSGSQPSGPQPSGPQPSGPDRKRVSGRLAILICFILAGLIGGGIFWLLNQPPVAPQRPPIPAAP